MLTGTLISVADSSLPVVTITKCPVIRDTQPDTAPGTTSIFVSMTHQ